MEITAAVYSSTFGGAPVPLENVRVPQWTDVLSQAGGFSFTLQNDDPDLGSCTFGRVVRFDLDVDPAFAGIIEAKTIIALDRDEESGEVTEIKGRGTMALNDSFVVYPEILTGPVGDVRSFNFASTLFDDSGWAVAMTAAITSGQGEPPDWPDSTIVKMSQVYDPDDNAPVGFNYFRKTITIPSTDMYRIFLSADDTVTMWIDGVLVVSKTDVIGKTTQTVDVRLTGGAHLFALEVENYAGGVYNIIWALFALYGLNQDGTLGTKIAASDATWKAFGFADPPGFTIGKILRLLRVEAVARGVTVPTLGFTDTQDSDGVAWPATPDVSLAVGLKGLAVLAQLAEAYVDLEMEKTTLELNAWIKGTKGAPSGVTYAVGNLTELVHEVRG